MAHLEASDLPHTSPHVSFTEASSPLPYVVILTCFFLICFANTSEGSFLLLQVTGDPGLVTGETLCSVDW